jgi:RNA polymerase sigma-70 factor (ECF subfamily)
MDASERIVLVDGLVREHLSSLRAYIYSRTGNAVATDDLVQDVFLIVSRKADAFDQARSSWLWLQGIARNEVRRYWRLVERDSAVARLSGIASENRCDADERAPGADSEQRLAGLRECLDKLPTKSRSALTMVYADGLSCEDIARTWETTGTAVRVYLHRVRTMLRDCIRFRLSGTST